MSDLYSILNKLTPDTPLSSTQYFYEEQKVLLWENSDTTSSFPAQTLSLDLEGYNEVEILSRANLDKTDEEKGFSKILIGNYGIVGCASATGESYWRFDIWSRGATVSSSGIVFETGHLANNVTGDANDKYCVPLKIYGIKKIG